ncbi:Ig-like domain-containing protein [Photorhabdus viridis]|uniref:Ig-like domain-containing protein n=1 Tax=Photorhabdus viridis TaxID=3163327 RepID=UPI0033070A0D
MNITDLHIDKQLADNIQNDKIQSIPPGNQYIRVVVTVKDNNGKPALSGVPIYWETTVNTSDMVIFNDQGIKIKPKTNVFETNTNSWGQAVIYISSWVKIITSISVALQKGKSPEYTQTLVFCNFDDNGTLAQPELPTDEHGRVSIRPEVYSVKASTGQKPPKPDYWCAAWLYGTVEGYLNKNIIQGKLINVLPVQQHSPVTLDVPYQWMDTKNKYGNQLAYLLYETNGSSQMSKKLVFSASGGATAMPDINDNGNEDYGKVVYYYDKSATLLTTDDLNAHGDLKFIIPAYHNHDRNDNLKISVYLNGWDSDDVHNHAQHNLEYRLSQIMGDSTFSISREQLVGFGASDEGTLGTMYIRYMVNNNDDGDSLSMIYKVDINFSDAE